MAKKKKSSAASQRSNGLAEQCQIQNVAIVDLIAKKSLRGGLLPSNTELSLKLDMRLDNEASLLVFEPKLQLVARYDDSAISESPVLIEVTFRVAYQISEGFGKITESDLGRFVESQAIFHIWPYFQELIRSLTNRMGLPALTIPLLNRQLMALLKEETTKQTKKKAKSRKKKTGR